MRRYTLALGLLAVALVAGCSGNDNVTKDEATEGWQVVAPPLQEGQQKISEKVQSKEPTELLSGDPIEVSVDCDDSGETVLRLSVEPVGGEIEVDFTATYDDCTANETIANGEVDIGSPNNFGISVPSIGGSTSDAGNTGPDASSGSDTVTLTYDGTIDYAGDVDGPCDVDLTVETSADGGGQPTYSGTLCGYDADEVLGFPF